MAKRGLFARKPGGTVAGNLLRGVTRAALTKVGLGGLPIATGAGIAARDARDVEAQQQQKQAVSSVINGAIGGAAQGFLNNTEQGDRIKQEVIEGQMEKYKPAMFVGGGLIGGYILLKALKVIK